MKIRVWYMYTMAVLLTGVGAAVGARVGAAVGEGVGARVGAGVGSAVGAWEQKHTSVSLNDTRYCMCVYNLSKAECLGR